MNKEKLLKLIESLELPKDEYYILGGGSLVICLNKRVLKILDLFFLVFHYR